jgi:UDP-2,3-diacylglucosamine pyrophosphatase LpxH
MIDRKTNFIKKARIVHGDKYDYSLVNYIRSDIKVKIVYNNIIYDQIPTSHLLGKCPENLNKRMTTEDFIKKARIVHGDKYDYSKVEYLNSNTKVKIILNGISYHQKPEAHLFGKCPENISKKLTINQFIEKSKKVHGDKYDYSLVDYINNSTKVKIILNDIIYEQTPAKHLDGKCPEKIKRMTTKDFIKKAKLVHGDKYDYSLLNYRGIELPVEVIYKNKIYSVLPYSHLLGKKVEKIIVKNSEDFIKKAKLVHGDKYDYSKVEYINSDTKVIIIINNKEYLYSPVEHLKGGVPKGTILGSRGEEKIKYFLEKNKIDFKKEFTFEDCKHINKLPFDFYISEYNILIEYDGEHHFKQIKHYYESHFKNTLRNDSIKNNFALKNKIPLLRIPYTEFNKIEDIIMDFIKKYK